MIRSLRSIVGRACRIVAVVLATLAAQSDALRASDYVHVCRTADGAYEINDGTLTRAGAEGSDQAAIQFTTKAETVLWRERGYCLSNAAKGQRYQYESKVYALRIAFRDGDHDVDTTAICELASDGLPAAYTCDKQVVVSKGGLSKDAPRADPVPAEPQQETSSFWRHNGSVMRLDAAGDRRRFLYEAPRPGMRAAGARRGTLLFDGVRIGNRYEGKSYVFAKGCAPFPFSVEGDIAPGEQRIVLRGDAPRPGPGCRPLGTLPDRLVFERMR